MNRLIKLLILTACLLTPHLGCRVADGERARLEEESHPLSGVYLAANKLFLELKKAYEQE